MRKKVRLQKIELFLPVESQTVLISFLKWGINVIYWWLCISTIVSKIEMHNGVVASDAPLRLFTSILVNGSD